MTEKRITIFEAIGALAIVVAFTLWNYWWQISDILFWSASALFLPVIIWKARYGGLKKWLKVVTSLALYIAIGLLWFNGPIIQINIPKLPPITINRS